MHSASNNAPTEHTSYSKAPQKKYRTVLGFGSLNTSQDTVSARDAPKDSGTYKPGQYDYATSRSFRKSRKGRTGGASVTDASFFKSEPEPAPRAPIFDQFHTATTGRPIAENSSNNMSTTAITTQTQTRTASRRAPVRIDAEGGPWSVSVAETPHDPRSFSLYIKTPTHNLTLTRTAKEIVDLHNKLRENFPNSKLPRLPIDISALPPPAKRKSNFLNTLSRLASPSTKQATLKSSGRQPEGKTNGIPSGLPTPSLVLSAPQEGSDPFAHDPPPFDAKGELVPTLSNSSNTVMTGVAAYLTMLSNDQKFSQSRVWRRFVRVRTDDLESVRVERAIKRVRSDLAAHVTPGSKAAAPEPLMPSGSASEVESMNESFEEKEVVSEDAPVEREASVGGALAEEGIQEEDEEDVEGTVDQYLGPAAKEVPPEGAAPQEQDAVVNGKEVKPVDIPAAAARVLDEDEGAGPSTPIASDVPRIPRSHSADPDKASRLSRAYTQQEPDGASSQTGDDSSVSTTADGRVAKKKRSDSSDPSKDSASKKKSHRKVVIDDFEMMRVLGKGCAGKVLLVRHRATADLYALKAITKRHVLAHQELQHTLTEQAVLKRMAAESKDPFVVKLWWSFHDKENLFLVMDFHPGGDLATQLARWGRLGRDRARFYAAEIVEGVEGLHAAGVIYRDLKPENILIGADGHIVLTDFGLSKEFPRRTSALTAPATPSGSRGDFYASVPGTPQSATPPWMKGEKEGELAAGWPGNPVGQNDSTSTFCGTAEYLAPEVIQGLAYSYEVDWWSFGTMLYEMLTGITPFWANNHSDMYVRVLQDELQFPDDRAMDQDTKSLIRGLLQRNPTLRICEPRIKKHPYFSMIDWSHVYFKRYIPPYIPPIDPGNASDTQNFDDTFLDMEPVIDDGNENEQTDTDQEREQTDAEPTDGEESNTTPSQSRSSSAHARQDEEESVDVFDGYSFKGRHSVIIDDEGEGSNGSGSEELDEDEKDALPDLPPELGLDAASADEDEVAEPKTPEARTPSLPPQDASPKPSEPASVAEPKPGTVVDEAAPRKSKDGEAEAPIPPPKEAKGKPPVPTKGPTARAAAHRASRKKERSGVPALDKYLSDTVDEEGGITERDEEDDDWDFIEAIDRGEDRNGAQGTSLFARGVVDRYRLAVFRKASTPTVRAGSRTTSGMSKASDFDVEAADSPTPSEKQRRGRTPLTFRKHPRQFLRPKSPKVSTSKPSFTSTTKPSITSKPQSLSHSASATLSAASSTSSPGLLSPSASGAGTVQHSLRSKESEVSMGQTSQSSDQSGSGDAEAQNQTRPVSGGDPGETVKGVPQAPTDEKHKPKKLKKYKEGAEKVFSIFQSPRQQT